MIIKTSYKPKQHLLGDQTNSTGWTVWTKCPGPASQHVMWLPRLPSEPQSCGQAAEDTCISLLFKLLQFFLPSLSSRLLAGSLLKCLLDTRRIRRVWKSHIKHNQLSHQQNCTKLSAGSHCFAGWTSCFFLSTSCFIKLQHYDSLIFSSSPAAFPWFCQWHGPGQLAQFLSNSRNLSAWLKCWQATAASAWCGCTSPMPPFKYSIHSSTRDCIDCKKI